MRVIDWNFVASRSKWILLAVPAAWVSVVVAAWSDVTPAMDVFVYARAAVDVADHGTAYRPLPIPGPHLIGPWYLYPPPFAALLSFIRPSPARLLNAMMLLNLAGVAAMVWAAGKLGGWNRWMALAAAGLLFLIPLPWLVITGSVHPAITGLAMASLVLPAAWAGAGLAMAAAVTVTPVWPLGVVLARCGAPARLAAGAITAMAALVSVAALGPAGFVNDCLVWIRDVAPTLSQGQFVGGTLHGADALVWESGWALHNISPSFALLRLLVDAPPPGEPLPVWARVWLGAMQFGVPLSVAYFTRREDWRRHAGWVLVAATIAAPILRPGYLPVLLLVPALLGSSRTHVRAANAERDGGTYSSRPPAIP